MPRRIVSPRQIVMLIVSIGEVSSDFRRDGTGQAMLSNLIDPLSLLSQLSNLATVGTAVMHGGLQTIMATQLQDA